MTNEEIGKRITKALKAEALRCALEGERMPGRKYVTARERVLQYGSSYNKEDARYFVGWENE
jgi:hypothetical protein